MNFIIKTKNYLKLGAVCFGLTSSMGLYAQQHQHGRNCHSMHNLEYRQEQNPSLERSMQEIERKTVQFMQAGQTSERNTGVITIPVVVHVIYSNSNENISEAQIQSQLDVLNEDFRRTNSDANNTWSQGVDSEIEFCLASVDPDGNSTTGITRKSSTKTSWGTRDAMKNGRKGGVDAWPADAYLNMWVCNIGGGILGYAQFPGGSASTDGVVMSPQFFGSSDKGNGFYLQAPFDKGRTATHEVGHWLNLRHIWGDGGCSVDDYVNDTPLSDGPNYGCATNHVSCGSADMVENYMDYSDDGCMNLFTQGQKTRMRALFATGGFREAMLNSNGCGNGGGGTGGPVNTDICYTVTIQTDRNTRQTSWSFNNANGAVVASGGNYKGRNKLISTQVCVTAGECYSFTINDAGGDGLGSGYYTVTDATGMTVASGGNFGSSETTNFCNSAARDLNNTAETFVGNKEWDVALFPNPVKGDLHIVMKNTDKAQARIMTITGKTLWQGQLDAGDNAVMTNDLAPGMYIFNAVRENGEMISTKFIKE